MVPLFFLKIHHRRSATDPGVVDQDVNLAELGHDLLHHGSDVGLFGDISGHADGPPAGGCTHLGSDFVQVGLGAAD